DTHGVGNAGEQVRFSGSALHFKDSAAILPALGWNHFAAEVVGQPLHAVTDSKNGQAHGENTWITFRSLGVIHRARTSGEDDAGRFQLANFLECCGARQDGRKNFLLANAPGDELSVLPAKVENDDAAAFGIGALLLIGLHGGSGGHCAPYALTEKSKTAR